MFSLVQYIAEASKGGGILHIEHPSDRVFDGEHAANHAINTLRGAAEGRTPITRKIDDKMSYQVIRTPDGRVGVKYKGTGANYNFSHDDIDAQHGDKPYLASSLHHVLEHIHKVIPNRPGEWQGGFMSSNHDRTIQGGRISHKPNTIEYSVPTDTKEGQKLKNSKISTVIHSELHGPNREAHPVLNLSEFKEHPDVHQVNHLVTHEEQHDVDPATKRQALHHLDQAEKMMKGHTHGHTEGHETHMRTYINSLIGSGSEPSAAGYSEFLRARHQKEIDAAKEKSTTRPSTIANKESKRDAVLDHVSKNSQAFDKTFKIHGHIQAATNLLARGLAKSAHGGYSHVINHPETGEKVPTGPEGFAAGGLKIVDRGEGGFTAANRARSAILKASPTLAKKV